MGTKKETKCPTCGGTGKLLDQKETTKRLICMRHLAEVPAKDVAKRMGFNPQYICDLESGRRQWRPELVESYEKAVAGLTAKPSKRNHYALDTTDKAVSQLKKAGRNFFL